MKGNRKKIQTIKQQPSCEKKRKEKTEIIKEKK